MLFEGKICNFYFNVISTIFSLIFFGICNVDGDCGFPAIPDHAQTQGSSWGSSGYQTFEEGSQVIFSCQTNFSDVQETKRIKTCSKNGTWMGDDIQCYVTVNGDLYSLVVNDSKTYQRKDPLIWTKLNSREFTGKLGLQLPDIGGIAFVRIHSKLSEGNSPFWNSSHLPEVRNGYFDCPFQNRQSQTDSEIQLVYSCSSRVTKGLDITFSYPVKIIDITVFQVPDNKCNGRPEIPLNALAEMVELETVRYRCRNGFVLQGKDTRSCVPDSGLWSPDAPSCERVDESSSSANCSLVGKDNLSQIGIGIVIGIGISIGIGGMIAFAKYRFRGR